MLTKNHLNHLVRQLLGSEEWVALWWHTPNKHWSGETPYQVWLGDPVSVEEYITYFIKKQNETENLPSPNHGC